MKNIFRVAVIILVSFLMISSVTLADTISAGDWIKLTGYNVLDSAGIMTFAVSHNGTFNDSFTYNTFCIQDDVYITPGAINRVAGISEHLTSGSGGASLDSTVAYLFDKFSNGDYNLSNPADQSKFQDLLWTLQQPNLGSATVKYDPLHDQWAKDAQSYILAGETGLHGTSVLNIVKEIRPDGSFGGEVQNQLYHQVPEPSTTLLFCMGLLGLVLGAQLSRSQRIACDVRAAITKKKVNG
jgi:hypothetical protein